MQKNTTFIVLLLAFAGIIMHAQPNTIINRIEPANWWTGMKTNKIQLLVHGNQIAAANVKIEHKAIQLKSTETSDNPNYLFLNIEIAQNALPGNVPIVFSLNGNNTVIQFPLLQRKNSPFGKKGFDASDAVYLIMPDRFAKGSNKNTAFAGYTDSIDRKNPNSRHGGDIAGIANNLEYIKNLGFTAIWINPLLENKMPRASYHGYAITDFYKIDPRFGSNTDYYNLVEKCHQQGMKVIKDFVLNHCGLHHWWENDLPSDNWYHHFNKYTSSNYRSSTLVDPYASSFDKKIFSEGWFDKTMPDLNQRNKFLAIYLIQNTLWWIEMANLDGIRLDTQPYSDMDFLANWVTAINNEYPEFTVVGESWNSQETLTACFQKSNNTNAPYNTNIHSVTDFPLCFALNHSVNENDGWAEGTAKIYNVLSQDFLYGDPYKNLIFLANHDITRTYEGIKGDLKKYKMLVAMLATLRGIPQFYYADEILMPGAKGKSDGYLRKDMPGGWPGDTVNVFTGMGLKKNQAEALEYTSKIFNWRKNSAAVARGTMVHFVPHNGLYVYVRMHTTSTILVAVNNNNENSILLDTNRYAEVLQNYTKAINVIDGNEINIEELNIPAKTALIFELKP